jgi:ABC-type Fe3+/spermidine/putrescine transport system ATPase subunit
MSGLALEVRGVSKTYGGQAALSEVSFTIQAGVHTALLGASGSGKTTALRLLAGLDTPSAGEVWLGDRMISAPTRIVLPPHRRGVAMVFQDLALWPNLSVHGNVVLGLAGAGLSRAEARARAGEALALCGIADLAARKPSQISGGQQQRVALARALAVRPTFLFLDEPFTSLDLVLRTRLLHEISDLAARGQVTLVLVTHDPLEATALCRGAVVLESGRAVEAGALADLLTAPRSEILKVFRDHCWGGATRSRPR